MPPQAITKLAMTQGGPHIAYLRALDCVDALGTGMRLCIVCRAWRTVPPVEPGSCNTVESVLPISVWSVDLIHDALGLLGIGIMISRWCSTSCD